jgi:hypothetical protein
MSPAIPAQERPARNVLIVVVSCVCLTRKHAPSAIAYSVRPACPSIRCSTRKRYQRITEFGNEKGLKTSRPATWYLGLFPISEGHKLIQNFLQSLQSPFLVGGCSCTSRVHLRAVRFTNLSYFFPKFLDTF